jgi:ammonia channel protein AmtB
MGLTPLYESRDNNIWINGYAVLVVLLVLVVAWYAFGWSINLGKAPTQNFTLNPVSATVLERQGFHGHAEQTVFHEPTAMATEYLVGAVQGPDAADGYSTGPAPGAKVYSDDALMKHAY